MFTVVAANHFCAYELRLHFIALSFMLTDRNKKFKMYILNCLYSRCIMSILQIDIGAKVIVSCHS